MNYISLTLPSTEILLVLIKIHWLAGLNGPLWSWDNKEKEVLKWNTLGGEQDVTVINESGLYQLSLSSKIPNTIIKITGTERRAGTHRKTDR